MIPFGTLMQATGALPAMGKISTGTVNPAAANTGTTQTGGEAFDSFSAWVRKLTGDNATLASNGEIQDQLLQSESAESETTKLEAVDWDQLLTMIAGAMELSPELSDEVQKLQNLSDVDLSGIQDALHQLANPDLLTGEGSSLPVLRNLVMDSANGSDQLLNSNEKPAATVQTIPGAGQEAQTNGQGQGTTASGTLAQSVTASGLTVTTEQSPDTGQLAQAQDEIKTAEFNQTLQTTKNKEKPVSPVDSSAALKEKPVSPVDSSAALTDDTIDEESRKVDSQRMSDGAKKVFQGDNPISSPKDTKETQQPLSVSTLKEDGNSTAADEDDPDNSRVVRSEIQDRNQSADAGEKELPKGSTSSDPIKTASPEQNRFSDTIQDATRTMTEKSGAIQAAPSERAEASAAQRFQTTVMDQIVDKANFRSVQGRSEIQIRLKPDFLGNVQMNITADKEQVVVRMITDHPVVKEVVEANLHHLKTELQHQGLTIDRFEVTVNPDAGQQQHREQFAQMFKNPSFQNGQGQDPEPEPETQHRGDGHQEDSRRSDDNQPEKEGINYFA